MTERAVWFDSHCHVDFAAFDSDRTQVIDDAREVGVRQLFVPGVRPRQWPLLPPLRKDHSGISIGFGIHPFFLHELSQAEIDAALELLPERCLEEGAVAVGECGVDALAAKRQGMSLDVQLEVFERQVRIAKQLELPVVVHTVRAHGAVLEILRSLTPSRGGVMHAYSGSAELVREYTALGFFFGFGAAVTQQHARRAKQALAVVPPERLLLETDSPDQPPEGFLSRNEPRALVQIANEIARQRSISRNELATLTTQNARRVFSVES